MSEFVEIVDVGPRDGLQSQPKVLDTDTKVELIKRLIATGIRRIEVASFVNPKRVPQMADADAVIARLPKSDEVRYIGLVLNRKGFDRALESGIDEINCATTTSDTFCEKNQGQTTAQMFDLIAEFAREAKELKQFFAVTLGTSFGCPFEGEIAPASVIEMVKRLVDMGVDEIAFADTIGVAGPSDVSRLVDLALPVIGDIALRVHFHNTRNTGIANAYAAVQSGVRIIDASCGGVGGCPFAPGATGNIATEDVLYMLQRMGMETGIDIQAVIDTVRWLEGPLGSPMPSMVSRAGLFPPEKAA